MAKELFDPQARAALRARIDRLTPAARARWGSFSVGEMLCHCADAIEMAQGAIPVADRSTFFFRRLIRPLVVHALPMPKGAPTSDAVNPHKGGTRPAEFEADRRRLIDALERICALPPDHAWPAHPLFGPLTRREWSLLGHKHLDHHLKQFGV